MYMTKPGDYLIDALRKHAMGQIEMHRANVDTYRLNPAGIGEHSDLTQTIEKELMEILTNVGMALVLISVITVIRISQNRIQSQRHLFKTQTRIQMERLLCGVR